MLKIAYHPNYRLSLPEKHRFPMVKYELLPQQLLHEGTCRPENFFNPPAADQSSILRAHDAEYFNALVEGSLSPREIRKTGFPWSEAMVSREIQIAGGTLQGCEYALEYGISMNIAGGTHHAYRDRGEAFCLLNDQAIAAYYLLAQGKARKILIVDLDVHQGNGTASIFKDVPEVFTFSMHGASNYPFKKEVSDLDIPLEKNTGDGHYLNILKEQLPNLLETVAPDFVFYLAGVDILKTDKLGTLACSLEGCNARDSFVLESCYKAGIPVQCSMGGGYTPELRIIIEAHAQTYRLAQSIYF